MSSDLREDIITIIVDHVLAPLSHKTGPAMPHHAADAILAAVREALLAPEAVATLEAGIVAEVLAPESRDRRMDALAKRSASRAGIVAMLEAAGITEDE